MADSGTGEKTEAATPQKLKELRKNNTARRSQDLPSAVSLVVLAMVLPMLVGSMFDAFREVMVNSLTIAGGVDEGTAPHELVSATWDATKPVLGPLALVIAATIATHIGFTRSKPNLMALKPKPGEVFNPVKGIKRIVSVNSLVELAKGVAKVTVVSVVAYLSWKAGVSELLAGVASVETFTSSMGGSIHGLVVKVAMAAVVIGIADAIWQNKRYNKQARMSKYDVKREYKQSEGDPMIKAQIRARGQAMTRNSMVAAAADADVVVVNPTHIAIALSYAPDMPAPKVLAKGAGHVALRIREIAEENNVPIRRDVPLARALHSSAEVGQFIPVELYVAAATLLADVFKQRSATTTAPGGITR